MKVKKTVVRSSEKTISAPAKQKKEAPIPVPKHEKVITAEGWRRQQKKKK